MMDEDKFEKFFKAIKAFGLVSPLIAPKSQLKQLEELEVRRVKLSHFCTPEQIKELEQIAFERAAQTLHSNHDVVCDVLDRMYDHFASGGDFEQAIKQDTNLLNDSNPE